MSSGNLAPMRTIIIHETWSSVALLEYSFYEKEMFFQYNVDRTIENS